MQRSDHAPYPSLPFEGKSEAGNNEFLTSEQTLNVNSKALSSNSDDNPSFPRMSRAFSVPLPSQTCHWQHPSRTPSTPENKNVSNGQENADQCFHDLSLELADSVQLAVQTFFQLSPPHVFDSAKEQFSGCSVQIPTPSLSGLLTSMKFLNYLSANLRMLASSDQSVSSSSDKRQVLLGKDEFDIGELLQSVGDSFGGIVSQAQVDLVLHHGDAMKHMGVKGDECGVSYALSHILHQVLATTRQGDSIEIGLSITGQPSSSSEPSNSLDNGSPLLDASGPLICTFDVAHKFVSFVPSLTVDTTPDEEIDEYMRNIDPETVPVWRTEPQFNSIVLRRLLDRIGGTLRPLLKPRTFSRGRRCELSITMDRGPSLATLHQRTPAMDESIYCDSSVDIPLAKEQSVDELMQFADSVRGKKVTFYASSRGSFAHHLTRYLTAWGLDISHVPLGSMAEKDTSGDVTVKPCFHAEPSISVPTGDEVPPIVDSLTDTTSDEAPIADIPPSFIIIDDDIYTLRQRLLQHRAELAPNIALHARKRASLVSHHQSQSSPSIRPVRIVQDAPLNSSSNPFATVPIVHFTNLGRYKLVKDVIQTNIFPVGGSAATLVPEVIVVPKPAGPRRILAALHTATRKPVVDPFFSPIATSPMSPSGHFTSFISSRKRSEGTSPQSPTRNSHDRLSRTNPDATTLPSVSPLSLRDRLEYFSESAVQKLGSSPASGLVVKSPDGRPAGIFFQPQSRTSSSRSGLSRITSPQGSSRPPMPSRKRTDSYQTTRLDIEDSTAKAKLSFPEPNKSPLEISQIGRSEGGSNNKGKGHMDMTQSQTVQNFMPKIGWREATQILAKPPTPLAPSLVSTPSSGARSTVHSPLATQRTSSPPSLVHSPSSQPAVSPTVHSPTSPSGDAKLSPGRRTSASSKVPSRSTSSKKSSKGVGSNIVPPINVLLVEDNPINQTIVSTFMKKNKIKYDVAWNGKEAVEKWKTGNFHIILMDIQMPVMDGIEATKEIRRLEKMENIRNFPPSPGDISKRPTDTPGSLGSGSTSTPFRSQVIIVALTASSLQSDRVAALAAGCNDFLTKPVVTSWLADKIIEWGSIKALQMWAELRPDIENTIRHEQAAQAQAVAERLHVPPSSSRRSPRRRAKDISDDTKGKTDVEETSRRSDREGAKESSNNNNLPLQSVVIGAKQQTFTENEPPSIISPTAHSSSTLSVEGGDPALPIALSGYQHSYQSAMSLNASLSFISPTSPTEEEGVANDTNDTIEQDNSRTQATEVTGKDALILYLEDTKEQGMHTGRPIVLGQRAMEAFSSSRSIASVQHGTVPDEDDTGQRPAQAESDESH